MDYTNDSELNGKYLGTITKNYAKLQSVEMFPHTNHAENVVLLELK